MEFLGYDANHIRFLILLKKAKFCYYIIGLNDNSQSAGLNKKER